jgi:hypothetical protein
MSRSHTYVRALIGFALAILLFFGATAALEVRDFHPTEEFSTPGGLVAFSIIALGGSLLICSGTSFGLGLAAFGVGRRQLPVPFSIGLLAGLLAAILARAGVVGHYGRAVPLPFPVATALPGLIAAVSILPIAFLLARTTTPSTPGT